MLIQGDSVRIPLPDKSVHCVTTSPPYWGLRKYAGDQGAGLFPDLGLEPTPQEHIERMVAIFAEVHRVLRDDGVVFLNYGDCYATSPAGNLGDRNPFDGGKYQANKPFNVTAVKQGNLMLMPHRIAIALQDFGWIVRNDLVWRKANPMPESQTGTHWKRHRVKDENDEWIDCPGCEKCLHTNPNWPQLFVLNKGSFRHTRAHEFIFQLVKGPKMRYWANQEAVRENTSEDSGWAKQRAKGDNKHQHIYGTRWHEGLSSDHVVENHPSGRNPRSVLDVPTAPYKKAHYATYPPNLIAPLIRATCPRWACPVCGQGWSPVVDRSGGVYNTNYENEKASHYQTGSKTQSTLNGIPFQNTVKEYRPTCEHPHTIEEAIPGTVFDPFVGSGTTVQVAKQLLRRGIGLDISMEYLDEQAKIRTGQGSPSNVLDDLPLFELIDK